jgi:HAD superfamily hydrolase (TIGR01459 family)
MPRSPLVPIPTVSGLRDIADRYEAFVVDLWGVLHDGVVAYPGAVEGLRRLKAMGKRIGVLSNAPRRAAEAARRTAELGIGPALYDRFLTSGEETWLHLKERPDAFYRRLGRACFHLGPDRDRGLLDGLDLTEATDLAKADFVLNTGAHMAEDEISDFEPILAPAAARGLPMICANPDLEVIRGGQREICAGMLAQRYEELGGRVRYHGKPDPAIYEHCFNLLGIARGTPVLGIGDSLRTDIAGAVNAGIDALLVTGGIHADELGAAAGAHPDPQALTSAIARAGCRPNFTAPAFVW